MCESRVQKAASESGAFLVRALIGSMGFIAVGGLLFGGYCLLDHFGLTEKIKEALPWIAGIVGGAVLLSHTA